MLIVHWQLGLDGALVLPPTGILFFMIRLK
jgi:hypothetical protein